jgi:hypothetical protein
MQRSSFKIDHPPLPGKDAVLYAIRTQPFLPQSLPSGPFAGVSLREVPDWFLQAVLESGGLTYEHGEAVGREIIRRQMGIETTPTFAEMLDFSESEARRMKSELAVLGVPCDGD